MTGRNEPCISCKAAGFKGCYCVRGTINLGNLRIDSSTSLKKLLRNLDDAPE